MGVFAFIEYFKGIAVVNVESTANSIAITNNKRMPVFKYRHS